MCNVHDTIYVPTLLPRMNPAMESNTEPARPQDRPSTGIVGWPTARAPMEVFLAFRYLKFWRALATCLLLSAIVIALILLGADLVFALTR